MTKLILASASRHRAKILDDAGLTFAQIASTLDERAIDTPLEEADVAPEDRAIILAEAKATDVSERNPNHIIIGCDQILSFNNQVLHKPKNMEDARRRLLAFSGRDHFLHSSVVIVKNGETLWRHVSTCTMSMRDLTPEFIGRHLADVGEGILGSVGAYHIEGRGIQLFDNIEGDLFSIIGLPLLPLLSKLRELDVIDG